MSDPHALSADLPEQAFDALKAKLRSYAIPTRARGINYAGAGRVRSLDWTESGARALVQGTTTYAVSWHWDGRVWSSGCSCPVGRDCKHLYAAGTAMIQEHHAAQKAIPPTQDLDELRAAPNAWRRTRALSRLLLASKPELEPIIHRPPISLLLDEQDFDLMCWHIARVLEKTTNGWLPPALEPYRNRDDLEAQYREDVENGLVQSLANWAGAAPKPSAGAERSVRFLVGLVLKDAKPALAIEVRLTSPRLTDDPRNLAQISQLVSDANRHAGRLPADQLALLETLLDAVDSSSRGWGRGWAGSEPGFIVIDQADLLRFVAQAEGTDAVVWHDDTPPTPGARYGMAGRRPVRVAPQPVTIVPDCEEREGGPVIDLFVKGPAGEKTNLENALYLAGEGEAATRSGIVVIDGALHRVIDGPPEEIVRSFMVLGGGLKLDARRHGRLVSTLTRAFPDLGASLRRCSVVRHVVPMIAVDIRDSDWIQMRVYSVPAGLEWTPDQAPAAGIEEYAPARGWLLAAATAPGDAPQRLELPDDDALEPALSWLERTGAQDGTRATADIEHDSSLGWWLSMSARRMTAFAAAWNERPAAVRWYCTPRAKRLLIDNAVVRAKVSVRKSGLDFFELSAEWELEGAKLSADDLARLANAPGPYVRISSGWVRREEGDLAAQQANAFADLGVEPGAETRKVSLWELAQVRPGVLEQLAACGMDAATDKEIAALRARVAAFEGLPRVDVPAKFVGTLRGYQQQGLDFLVHASTLGLGAVLADDMGLGKTIQALAWLLWLREHDAKLGPALVVCPASVVHNWEREARAFAPDLRVVLVTSGAGRRHQIERAQECDLIVTNFSLLRRDIELWKKVPLGVAILDEAQFIKNPDAAVSRAAVAISARHRLALTGTPLENRALDLWSIMEFAQPGLLGTRRQFIDRYDRADTPPHRRRLLAARLRPVLLRRLKTEVAKDLPPRIEERRDCELGPRQRKLYAAELIAARREIEQLAASPGGVRQNKLMILARLTRLRQICCHPALVGGAHATEAGPMVSGKFEALWEVLEPLMAEGQKVLVFSQFVRCLELLEREMTRRGIAHHKLTGQTTRRGEVVAAFESDPNPCVFLISLKAGGTGLNLTAASYVVLFDPWWNPAVEAQAIDRTHRIGQTRTVVAYRMLALGTIEEKIWELQARKAALAKSVLSEEGFARALTKEDLEYLLQGA